MNSTKLLNKIVPVTSLSFCIRIHKAKNLYLFLVYWVLIQALYIGSFYKDLVIAFIFLSKLFVYKEYHRIKGVCKG